MSREGPSGLHTHQLRKKEKGWNRLFNEIFVLPLMQFTESECIKIQKKVRKCIKILTYKSLTYKSRPSSSTNKWHALGDSSEK